MKNKSLEKFKKVICHDCNCEFYYGSSKNFYFGIGSKYDLYICDKCIQKIRHNQTNDTGPK